MNADGSSPASTAERTEAGEAVEIRSGSMLLAARWRRPPNARGVVVVAHCPSCGDEAPLVESMASHGYASLLPDLLLPAESNDPSRCHDEEFISQRLRMAAHTAMSRSDASGLPLAVLGRGCAGDAALVAAGIESAIVAVVAIDPPLLLHEAFLERVSVPALVVARLDGASCQRAAGVPGVVDAGSMDFSRPAAQRMPPRRCCSKSGSTKLSFV
jgi:hypothetical protein